MDFTPIIAQALTAEHGIFYVGVYLAAAALISFAALWPLKQSEA